MNERAEADKGKIAARFIERLRIGQHRRVDWCSGVPLEESTSVEVSNLLEGVCSDGTDKSAVKVDEAPVEFFNFPSRMIYRDIRKKDYGNTIDKESAIDPSRRLC
jgi:hypothetical protein